MNRIQTMLQKHLLRNTSILITLPLLLNSCFSYSKDKITRMIELDTLHNIPSYSQYTFFEAKDTLYFCIKPWKCDSLLLYTRDCHGEWKIKSFLKIPKAFLNSTNGNNVDEWVFINKDTIIAYTSYTDFTFLDIINGNVICSVPENTERYNLDSRCFNHLQWNHKRASLPLMYISWNYEERKYRGDVEIAAEYSLKSGLHLIPVKYPYEISDSHLNDYNSFFNPLMVSHDNIVVFAFTTSPIMIYFDQQKGKAKVKSVKNKYYKPLSPVDTNRIAELSPPNFIMEQYLTNFFFESLLYDPYKKMYYRFFSKDMPLKNKEGLFNTMEDKVYGVTLLNDKLKPIGDVCFKSNEYKRKYFVSCNGLFNASQSDGKVIISKLTFDYE